MAAAAGLAAPAGGRRDDHRDDPAGRRRAPRRPVRRAARRPGARRRLRRRRAGRRRGRGAHRPGRRHPSRPGRVPVLVHERPRERRSARWPRWSTATRRPACRCSASPGPAARPPSRTCWRPGWSPPGGPAGCSARSAPGSTARTAAQRRLPAAFTTPEAPDLQALFAVMAEAGVTDVAMEVSSHALALGRVAGTRFAVAAFTNLSQDHLDFHRDMEDYFAAKATLFDGRAERAVICVDDAWGQRLAARTPDAVTVSTTGPAGWRAADARHRRRRHPAVHRARPRRRRDAGAAAAARRVQRGQRAGRAGLPGRGRGAGRGGRRRVRRGSPCPAGCSGSRPASRSWPWSTTRTSRPRWPRCWTRCAPRCRAG